MRRSIQRRGLSTTHIVLIVVGSLLLVSCLVLPLLLGIFLPAVATARDAAKTAKSMTQIKMIIQAVDQYQRDHSGQQPASVQALTDGGLAWSGINVSPFGPAADGRGDYWVDFTLGGERREKEASTLIVCVDRAMLAGDRPTVVVGYADGHAAAVDRSVVEQFMRTAGSGPPSTQPATSP